MTVAALDITYDQFDEAVQYLQDQGLDLSGLDLQQTYDEEHDLATVAVLVLLATLALQTVKTARALEALGAPGGAPGGGPGQGAQVDYRALVSRAVDQYGTARLPTAVDTNARVSYSAGRMARGASNPDVTHYLYRTMRDSAVRPEHRLLEGVVLPKTHEFWKTHTPPLDYHCRCKLLFTNEAGLREAGLTVTTELPRVHPALTTSPVEEGPLATSAALDPRTALQRLLAERLAELAQA